MLLRKWGCLKNMGYEEIPKEEVIKEILEIVKELKKTFNNDDKTDKV